MNGGVLKRGNPKPFYRLFAACFFIDKTEDELPLPSCIGGTYNGKAIDKEAEASLDGFDTMLIDHKVISFLNLPFELEFLESKVRDSLHQYISYNNQMMTFDQIKIIASATINDQMISSTKGKGIARNEFNEELEKRIILVADKYSVKRIPIHIRSFTCATKNLEDESKNYLSFVNKFDGRKLKDKYDWNKDIYEDLEKFLLANTSQEYAYQISLDTHTSLAFAAGRIVNIKFGINVFPTQKTNTNGIVLWDVNLSSKKEYFDWNILHETFKQNQSDTALILNVTNSINDDVIDFIEEKDLSIGSIIKCTIEKTGDSKCSIHDGTHAFRLAESLNKIIAKRSKAERLATLHIFASAPNAFMFFLGQNSMGFGKCILYEYDFEQRNSGSYLPSIDFTK